MPSAIPARSRIARSRSASAFPSPAAWPSRATGNSALCIGTPPKKRSSNAPCRIMDFEYTPEQIQLRKSVREFAEAEIAPHVMEWDEGQIFPLEVIRKLATLGNMGASFPEE